MKGSELIINGDGTIFHLHLTGEMIADDVILVGDPARADFISSYFDTVKYSVFNREFKTYTGTYKGHELTVMSTGIGVGNIDIVVNELSILASLDLKSGDPLPQKRHLNLLRIGTCGAVSNDILIGDYVASEYSIGTDALAFFYRNSEAVRCLPLEPLFEQWPQPVYAVKGDDRLLSLFDGFAKRCITVSAVGFYGPQGRNVLMQPWTEDPVNFLQTLEYKGFKVGNFEMEGAPMSLLARLAGMSSATVCAVIAQRVSGVGNPDYQAIVRRLVEYTLEKLSK